MRSRNRVSLAGSSPRAWGTHSPVGYHSIVRRFIPTYMGNTHPGGSSTWTPTVHPHVHGEHYNVYDSATKSFGSSPRTWGTPIYLRLPFYLSRFIPTYMGNTGGFRLNLSRQTVHPHVHGEHDQCVQFGFAGSGSSPRTWGTRFWSPAGAPYRRFIPTYMGNTPAFRKNSSSISVHPHVHGEHSWPWQPTPTPCGSSPRTWGTPPLHDLPERVVRFIPTYMGNTTDPRNQPRHPTVHPHVHGEHTTQDDGRTPWNGSSPRTWGTLDLALERLFPDRFIPTYMGNT